MTRYVFPEDRTAWASAPSQPLLSAAGRTVTVYADAACTQQAVIHTYPADQPIPNASLVIDDGSLLPLFYGPDEVKTLYISTAGVAYPIYARFSDRVGHLEGLIGSPELIGPPGAKGDKGDTGPAGAQGPKGDTGATGATGPKGDTGATGAAGAAGAAGPKGDKGDPGATGAKGDTGATGAQGLQGLKGDTGATGPAGVAGAKGDQGDQGLQGPKGDTGASGPAGAAGATGPAGQNGKTPNFTGAWNVNTAYSQLDVVTYAGSAYVRLTSGSGGSAPPTNTTAWQLVAQAGTNGTNGTSFTWRGTWSSSIDYAPNDVVRWNGALYLAVAETYNNQPDQGSPNWTIMVPAGADGAPGAAGATGPKGDTGAQGIQGIQGPKGDTGATGAQGATGPTGATPPLSNATPATAASTASPGTGTNASRDDHVHLDVNIEPYVFSVFGTAVVVTGQVRIYAEQAMTIASIRIAAGTAPTGASLIADVRKNNTSIYTTTANRPTLAAGTNTQLAATPDTTTLAAGDYLTVDIVQVGSTVPGSNVSVTIRLRRT